MPITKKYFHDRTVLLLLGVNIFLAFLVIVSILFRLQLGGGSGFIVQYRANLGIDQYQAGGLGNLLSFIGFAIVILATNVTLSHRAYHIRRQLSLLILTLGVLLLLLCVIVSNALLALH
jgi:hypothetical protein